MKPITITNHIDVTNEALIAATGLVSEVKNRVTSGLADALIGHLHEGEFVISVTDVVMEFVPYSALEISRFSQRIKMTPLVRCKDCKHREIYETCDNKTYKECELDTGDPWELGRKAYDDDWFCADGERREDEMEKIMLDPKDVEAVIEKIEAMLWDKDSTPSDLISGAKMEGESDEID